MKSIIAKILAATTLPFSACATSSRSHLQGTSSEALSQPDGRCTDAASMGAALPCQESKGKPVSEINPSLLENRERFSGEFYERFELRHAATPLTLPNGISKNYFFPTLYGDVTSSVALFFCSYEEAKALMPDPALKPVHMGLGRSVIVISSYRYNKVFGIAPYNEIGISIPVVADNINVPLLPLLLDGFKGLGFYVVSMPVTTLENRIRGQQIWGLRKVLQEIDLKVDGDDYVTTAFDESGKPYLELRVPMQGESTEVDQKNYLYSSLNEKVVRSPSYTKGTFVQTKWPKTFVLKNQTPEKPFLTLGESSAADVLRNLKIEPQPFQVRFSAGAESMFDLPESKVGDRKARP